MIDERLTSTAAEAAALLGELGIDLGSKGGKALLCCAVAACSMKGAKVKDLCAWYADWKGSNIWAVHRNMSAACARALCGYSPGKLLRQIVKGVTENES